MIEAISAKYPQMQNVNYSFSSVHIDVANPLSDEIIKWGREHISDDDIFVSQTEPTFGREDEIHITILYGLHSNKPDQVEALFKKERPIQVRLGRVEIFTNPAKFDVVVINVISEDLERLNKKLATTVPYTERYGDYQPHLTIAYVKKGKGWKHKNLELWAGKKISTDHVVFSSKSGFKKRIDFC